MKGKHSIMMIFPGINVHPTEFADKSYGDAVMSRYNPFAKTKRSEEGASPTEPSSGISQTSFSQPQPEEELKTDLGRLNEVRDCDVQHSIVNGQDEAPTKPVSAESSATATRAASPPLRHGFLNIPAENAPSQNISNPTYVAQSTPPHPASRPPPASPHLTSRWRLLWRGGLEVGAQRYRLDGIAFCAKMSFGVPGSGSRVGGTPMGRDRESVDTGGGAQVEKEMAMREEGSYFTSTATQTLPISTSISTSIEPTASRPRRPLLRTQSNTIESNPFTPGGSLTAHAFETSDPDLCLSLESMKGRQTLRVRGVERLEDGEVFDAGEGGVHV